MTFGEAKRQYPEYATLLNRIQFIASLERKLTQAEEVELSELNAQDERWRSKLGLI